jgi:Superfamily II DNA/RNA helicases, SNF2 family
MSYTELLARRTAALGSEGREVADEEIHGSLKPFQRRIVRWAVRGARRAIWADTGLGKTRMQLEWARLTADTSLIVAPLAVCEQAVEEAAKIGIAAAYVRSPEQVTGPGTYVTNYEMVEHFPASMFGAVVLDEASILKQSTGRTRTMLIQHFRDVPYRLACTATPGPNDPEELTNQAEFLGIMTRTNMLAAYFIHDQDGWRLKGHAAGPMIRWMNTWAFAIRRPSDIGDSDDGYILPGLQILPEVVKSYVKPEEGQLFAAAIGGVTGRSRVRKETMADRIERAVELVKTEPNEPWMLWCGLNDEADALAKAIPGAVNIHGSLTPEQKAEGLRRFAHGEIQVLISKPSIASFGLNWQHCARTAFVGLSDSYESYYQCIRRFYRFGQERVVHAHIILSAIEQQIASNVMRKEKQANRIIDGMIAAREDIAA